VFCYRLFFDHLGTILLMAVVGTIFNTLTIGTSKHSERDYGTSQYAYDFKNINTLTMGKGEGKSNVRVCSSVAEA
jgi:hypothetical protein